MALAQVKGCEHRHYIVISDIEKDRFEILCYLCRKKMFIGPETKMYMWMDNRYRHMRVAIRKRRAEEQRAREEATA